MGITKRHNILVLKGRYHKILLIKDRAKLLKKRITFQFIVLVDCKVRKLYYSVWVVFIHCLRRPEQLNGMLPATTLQFSYYEWLISIHTQWDNKIRMYVSVSIFSVSKGPYQSKNYVCREGCVSVHTVSKSIFFTRNTCVRRSFVSAWGCLVYQWKVCIEVSWGGGRYIIWNSLFADFATESSLKW